MRGLADMGKRRLVLHWLKDREANVILLQETHSTKDTEHLWKSDWEGDIIFSHGTSSARGACILFKKGVGKEIFQAIADENGRFVILDI